MKVEATDYPTTSGETLPVLHSEYQMDQTHWELVAIAEANLLDCREFALYRLFGEP